METGCTDQAQVTITNTHKQIYNIAYIACISTNICGETGCIDVGAFKFCKNVATANHWPHSHTLTHPYTPYSHTTAHPIHSHNRTPPYTHTTAHTHTLTQPHTYYHLRTVEDSCGVGLAIDAVQHPRPPDIALGGEWRECICRTLMPYFSATFRPYFSTAHINI